MISPTTETVVEYISTMAASGKLVTPAIFSCRFPPPNVRAAIRIAKRRGLIVPARRGVDGTWVYEMGSHWLAAQSEPRLHAPVGEVLQHLAKVRRIELGYRLAPETSRQIRAAIHGMLWNPVLDDMDAMAGIIASLGGRDCDRRPSAMRTHIYALVCALRDDRRRLHAARRVVERATNRRHSTDSFGWPLDNGED